ncbi:hypothetical protein evm_013824 [Chilo suppressalis]|nr:hypothetical protein evm_013824 [Chilo suppressalis]
MRCFRKSYPQIQEPFWVLPGKETKKNRRLFRRFCERYYRPRHVKRALEESGGGVFAHGYTRARKYVLGLLFYF